MTLPNINFLHLTVSEIYHGQDFIGQGHYGKVKGQIKVMPWHCTPTPPHQCPYQVSTSYTLRFPRYRPDKIFKFKVTTARSNQGQTMMLHTYTSQPMSLPSINFLHLTVSEIQPGQTFSRRLPMRTPWGKNVSWALFPGYPPKKK